MLFSLGLVLTYKMTLIFKAPGTFGYDYSKYRPHLEDDTIPMADMSVGHRSEADSPTEPSLPYDEPQTGEPRRESKGESTESEDRVRMRIQPSPAPFSRYQPSAGHQDHEGRSRLPAGLTTADIKPPAMSGQGRRVHTGEEEKDVAGCCKCIIM